MWRECVARAYVNGHPGADADDTDNAQHTAYNTTVNDSARGRRKFDVERAVYASNPRHREFHPHGSVRHRIGEQHR